MNIPSHHSGTKGFTLVEAIVVSVILAILAAVGIPSYMGYVQSTKIDGARSSCQIIGTAIIQTHNRGIDISNTDWSDIGITSLDDNNWTYTFPALAGATNPVPANYAITATGVAGSSVAGKSGTFCPKASGSSRWTGTLAY
ncbi:MAG: prepilin-type N-terminal cleavage/methylation domain-containing protein [Chitinispirillaceae bacterium]|nr:prepilin-type N-terminal cleavage/methylation domain-containing protein [Chitinispirillaceae bacterium]